MKSSALLLAGALPALFAVSGAAAQTGTGSPGAATAPSPADRPGPTDPGAPSSPGTPGAVKPDAGAGAAVILAAALLVVVILAIVAMTGRPAAASPSTAGLTRWGAPGAPHTPRRSGRPGPAVAPLDHATRSRA